MSLAWHKSKVVTINREPEPDYSAWVAKNQPRKEGRFGKKPNVILVGPTVSLILCRRHNGAVVAVSVDTDDLPLLSKFTWAISAKRSNRTMYAVSTEKQQIRMHRLILGSHACIDHKNGRGTDNRRCNLRPATNGLNRANSKTPIFNKSGYLGVHPSHAQFMAKIQNDHKLLYLGTFATREEAARAYDAKAIELFGEFARLNFPQEVEG